MTQTAAEAFGRALTREREAAVRVDLVALERAQEDKRAILPALSRAQLDDRTYFDLVARAQANIALIRQLVHCLRGCVEAEVALTYAPPPGQHRLELAGLARQSA